MSTVAAETAAAVRVLLPARGVPPHRVELAVRAVDALLSRATTVRDDGTVYVSTGDIPAMWLRDSTWQTRPLFALAPFVPELRELVAGVLRLQVEHVLHDPRANAFAPSGRVFERKYALDSLCGPLALGALLPEHRDERFRAATETIVALLRAEQEHDGAYVFRRLGRRRATLSHRGRGAPVERTGMVWSAFRPSDDRCVYGFHVPANAFAAVSLERLGVALDLAAEIRAGIAAHAVVDGRYAYEVDGRGNALLLDDANVPSLLSLPYLGFCGRDDPLYVATRAAVLGPDNPLWARGSLVHGVGSAHTPRGRVWPLAIAVEGLTSGSDEEREDALRRLEATVTGDELFHESVDPSRPRRFTRRWFSWADMLYVELVLLSAGLAVESAPG